MVPVWDQDLQSAERLLSPGEPILRSGLFHCQQAVEKWFKSLLISHGVPFPKSHALGKIGALCVEVEPGLLPVVESVADLTDFATVYRYPGTDLVLEPADADEWISLTRRVRAEVLARMPEAVRGALS